MTGVCRLDKRPGDWVGCTVLFSKDPMPSTPSLLNDRDLADHVVELVQDASPEALRQRSIMEFRSMPSTRYCVLTQ